MRIQAAPYLIAACILGLACVSQDSARASMLEQRDEVVSPEYRAPHDVVKVFLKAVDRGEVVIFGHTLKRASLIPLRVEYIYELADLSASVKIFASLIHPISVPELQNMKVFEISATLNPDGKVTEVSVFVKADKTDSP